MLPIAYWFRQERHALLSAMLLDSFFVREGLFRRAAVQRLLEEHRDGRVDNHVRLWMLLNLSLWHQIYIQGTSVADAGEMMKQRESAAI
jgi:asparagine synthase (glutamine-hydrolysing)